MKETKRPKISQGYCMGDLTVVSDTGARKNGYAVWQCSCRCGGTIALDTRTLQRGTIRDCGCRGQVKPGQQALQGRRFGKLVALEPTAARSSQGSIVWKCRCDCGAEILAAASQLTQGYKKSCGCISRPPLKDYVGQRFGRLTVRRYAGKTAGMHRWECLCDCGNTTVVGQTLLQSGKTKSCGCLSRPPVPQLQGRRFGELTVLAYDDSRKNQHYWRCSCSCGNETVVRQHYLLSGKTKSCGCLQSRSVAQNMKFVDGTSVVMLEKAEKRLIRSNSSGYNGVYFNKKTQKWVAQIGFKGKTYYLGSYEQIEDAIEARQDAQDRIYGPFLAWYYENHPKK